MERMGHNSTRAALIYLHASRAGDRRIADGIGRQLAGDDGEDQGDRTAVTGRPGGGQLGRDLAWIWHEGRSGAQMPWPMPVHHAQDVGMSTTMSDRIAGASVLARVVPVGAVAERVRDHATARPA
jgi:hypothetical protein